MMVLDCEIEIKTKTKLYKFRYCENVEIKSTWKEYTDTCIITLPNNFKSENRTIYIGDNNVFERGSEVSVSLGYLPNKQLIYKGYLVKVAVSSKVELFLEDESYLLKQLNLNFSYKNVSLSQLLKDNLTTKFNAIDANLGAFRAVNVNGIQILEELKKTYGLVSYFRGGVLNVGLAYNANGAEYKFDFNKNIIAENLEYIREEDVKLKVKAISIQPDNSKIEVELGDKDGDQRTLHYFNLKQSELKAIAEREINRLRYSGYRGSFTCFGVPVVKHGDIADINDSKFKERSGKYIIDEVVTTFGVNGYRQEVSLGAKV